MSTLRDSMVRSKSCVHFTGIQHERCRAGVRYLDVQVTHEPVPLEGGGRSLRVSIPCLLNQNHGGATCAKLQAPTEEEFEAKVAEVEGVLGAIDAGKSPCCGAPLDGSALSWSDAGKATGPRYCSKCGKLVDRLCNPSGEFGDGGDEDDG